MSWPASLAVCRTSSTRGSGAFGLQYPLSKFASSSGAAMLHLASTLGFANSRIDQCWEWRFIFRRGRSSPRSMATFRSFPRLLLKSLSSFAATIGATDCPSPRLTRLSKTTGAPSVSRFAKLFAAYSNATANPSVKGTSRKRAAPYVER
jgi:hypothetical protein